jgi:hypothetical protein
VAAEQPRRCNALLSLEVLGQAGANRCRCLHWHGEGSIARLRRGSMAPVKPDDDWAAMWEAFHGLP